MPKYKRYDSQGKILVRNPIFERPRTSIASEKTLREYVTRNVSIDRSAKTEKKSSEVFLDYIRYK